MKKIVIGMVAMTGLFFAGQASATTMAQALAGYEGPVKFKFQGVSQESNVYTGTANGSSGQTETWGIFQVTQIFKGTDVVWNSGGDTDYFGIYYGLYDKTVTPVGTGFKIDQQADETGKWAAGWTLYETGANAVDMDAPTTINGLDSLRLGLDKYTGMGAVVALQAQFASGVDPSDSEIIMQQTVSSATLPAWGSGSTYGNFTSGLYQNLFATSSVQNAAGGFNDFSMVFTLGGQDSSTVPGLYIDDPLRTNTVPEPATMLLFGAGLAGLAGFRRKNSK